MYMLAQLKKSLCGNDKKKPQLTRVSEFSKLAEAKKDCNMNTKTTPLDVKNDHWTSYTGFMLACIGAAVGLGNIWKFPYMAGSQGGGAFVLIYLATIAAIAIPIAVSEILLGRMGQAGPVASLENILRDIGRPRWFAIGADVGVLAAYVLLSFYAVIAGWVISYVYRAGSGTFSGITAEQSQGVFDTLLANPIEMIICQALFLGGILLVLSRNISKGLERTNLFLIPALFIMLILIAIYGAVAGAPMAALEFLFTPDFEKITAATVQSAVGHGFFSVGVGAAMLITFGAYMGETIHVGKAAIAIGLADTLVALLAGFGIFAIVFSQGLDPASGPGLIFMTLPVAFGAMPGGTLVAITFFILVLFAAFTSGLALAEVTISWAQHRLKLSRKFASLLMVGSVFLVGLSTVFSFNIWADIRFAEFGMFREKTIFDLTDYLASSILMPVSGLLVIVVTSWAIPQDKLAAGLGESKWFFQLWLWLSRLVAPIGIIWMFMANI
jgi:neurotransmitter:Na+ symporter, NSS family